MAKVYIPKYRGRFYVVGSESNLDVGIFDSEIEAQTFCEGKRYLEYYTGPEYVRAFDKMPPYEIEPL